LFNVCWGFIKFFQAKQISSSSGQVTYQSLTPMGTTHKILLTEHVDTLEKVFNLVARTHTTKNCMGTRKILKEIDEIQPDGKTLKKLSMGDYEWRSFIEAHTEATNFGKGIRELGVQPRERVAILAETRAEWMLAAQGFFKQACGIATIYATLGEDGIIYAINQTEVSTIVTSHDLLPKLRNVLDQIPSVKIVIYFEDQLNETNVDGMDRVRIYSYRDVIARGKESFLGEKN
jgi:long-chain acyl-CoA synthetase